VWGGVPTVRPTLAEGRNPKVSEEITVQESTLVQSSGLAAVAGGALFAAAWIVSAVSGDSGAGKDLAARWVAVAAHILILLGLVGIYATHSQDSGVLGFASFLMAFTGTAVFIGFVIGGEETAIPEPSLGPPAGLSWLVGFCLLAVAFWQSGLSLRWPIALSATGIMLYLAGIPGSPPSALTLAGAVLFALGFGWAGISLWT
jgi:hypothetical protein